MPAAPASPLLFENAAARLLADPAGFLRLEWSNNPRQLADTQALFGAVAQALRQRGWSRMLTDQTRMLPLSPAEQAWLNDVWLPGEGRTSGYHFVAVVVAGNVLSRLATAAITTRQAPGFTRYRSFDAPEAAAEWLLRQG